VVFLFSIQRKIEITSQDFKASPALKVLF